MTVSHRPRAAEPSYVTFGLLAAILLIYLLALLLAGPDRMGTVFLNGPNGDELDALGAYSPALVVGGHEYWRLISATFLHIGLMHLLFNSYALLILGPPLEREMGHGRFLLLYVLSGIAGSMLSVTLSPAGGAGASGAIFGLVGGTWSVLRRRKASSQAMQSILFIVVINFAFGLRPGSNIDNWAHLGGLIAGGVLGALLPGRFTARQSVGRTLDLLGWIIAVPLLAYGIGMAAQNSRVRLLHPERMPLARVQAKSGAYSLEVPADWKRESDASWDLWTNQRGLVLLASEFTKAEAPPNLAEAAELTKDLMRDALGKRPVSEMTVVDRANRSMGGVPAYYVEVYARPTEGPSMRLIGYWMTRPDRSWAVLALTPNEVSWAGDLLRRVAGTLQPTGPARPHLTIPGDRR